MLANRYYLTYNFVTLFNVLDVLVVLIRLGKYITKQNKTIPTIKIIAN